MGDLKSSKSASCFGMHYPTLAGWSGLFASLNVSREYVPFGFPLPGEMGQRLDELRVLEEKQAAAIFSQLHG